MNEIPRRFATILNHIQMIPYSLNTELLNVSQQLNNKKQFLEKLQKSKNLLAIESSKLDELKYKMMDEFKDVKDLEGITLKSIWYDLLNKKFSELEREKEEFYRAKMNYETQQNKVENIKIEIRHYETEVADFEKVKLSYEGLLKEKIAFLKENNHPKITEVFEKQEFLVKTNANIKEIGEALAVVENVLTVLPNVIQDLKTAKSYANWDTLGGGTGVTYLKRQKMREANLGIIEINYALNRLNRELKDISPDILPQSVEFNMSWEFADYFFDNFFVDLKIRSRIEDAYREVISLFDSMMVLKEKLINERNKQEKLYNEQESLLKEMIESY